MEPILNVAIIVKKKQPKKPCNYVTIMIPEYENANTFTYTKFS